MQGEVGFDSTEACKEVELMGVDGLLCLVVVVVAHWRSD